MKNLKNLKTSIKDVISSQEKKIEDYNLVLRKLVDIDFHLVSCEDLPTETVEIERQRWEPGKTIKIAADS